MMSMQEAQARKNISCEFSWSDNEGANVKGGSESIKEKVRSKEYNRLVEMGKAHALASADRGEKCQLNHPENATIDIKIHKKGMMLKRTGRIPNCADFNATVICKGPASDPALAKCSQWCKSHKPECVGCKPEKNCGGIKYDTLKRFTNEYKESWYACTKKKTRDEATLSNKQHCVDWCNSHKPKCVKCDTKRHCGFGFQNMKSWSGYGKNWHACKKK